MIVKQEKLTKKLREWKFHTTSLPKKFPKARVIVAYHNIQEIVDQLTSMGYEDFYSPLEVLKNYDPSKYEHK